MVEGKSGSCGPVAQPPKCPQCHSQRVWKDGVRPTNQGDVQRWLCRDCGYRFSPRNRSKNPSKLLKKRSRWSINSSSAYSLDRQVCELLTEDSKNLAEVQSRTEKRAAGATETEPTEASIKGKIIEYAWWMKKQGYKEATIKQRTSILKLLWKRDANLFEPETVKEAIAKQEWSLGTKVQAVRAYNGFLELCELFWVPPHYKPDEKLPFIPLEKEVDALIAAASKKMAAFLQLLKETGCRGGEASQLRWIDFTAETQTITINSPEKGSNPRMFKVSAKLTAMLNALPRRSDCIFASIGSIRSCYQLLRRRQAAKLQNPRLLSIRLHTFRHWKATMEYQRTRDILYVKKLLGHKRIDSTMLYTQMVTFENDEYHVKTASTLDEAKQLLEAGFEYVTDMQSVKLFRKRK